MDFYELLREINPHLPPVETVTNDTFTITAGREEAVALTLTVFIKLPTEDDVHRHDREQEQVEHMLHQAMGE